VPTIPGYFSGVGDLFSALLLAHFHPHTTDTPPRVPGVTALSEAASQALAKTHTLLQVTHEQSMRLPAEERQPSDDELDGADPLRKTRRMRGRELALIQGQNIIRGADLDDTLPLKLWDTFWSQEVVPGVHVDA
jgi:pyridoxine kinase